MDVDSNNNQIHIRNTRVQTNEGILDKEPKTEKSDRILPMPLFVRGT
jgi:hypothetical protein